MRPRGASSLPPVGDGSLKTIRTGGMRSGFPITAPQLPAAVAQEVRGALCPPAFMELSSMNLCSQFFFNIWRHLASRQRVVGRCTSGLRCRNQYLCFNPAQNWYHLGHCGSRLGASLLPIHILSPHHLSFLLQPPLSEELCSI